MPVVGCVHLLSAHARHTSHVTRHTSTITPATLLGESKCFLHDAAAVDHLHHVKHAAAAAACCCCLLLLLLLAAAACCCCCCCPTPDNIVQAALPSAQLARTLCGVSGVIWGFEVWG